MKTFFLLLIALVMAAQTPPSRFWNAGWIGVPAASPRALKPGANHLEVKFK